MNAGEIVAHLKARADEFRSGIRQAREELNGLTKSAEQSARRMGDIGKKMTKFITLPIAAIGTMAVKTAAGFEAAMNKVSALSGAVGTDLSRLKDLAMEMGRETRYSAVEAAEGLSFLAMAGFDTEQSIAALPPILDMAAAGAMDLAQAADYASNILTGFNLDASEMARVTDILTATFTSSNTNLSQLAEGMKYVAPVASGLGMEIEEVAAAMGMLGDAGIQGSMAGTTLRQVLLNLVSPTGRAVDVLDELGIVTQNAEGEFVGLTDIVRQLEEAGASTADMMEIFGARGAGMIAIVSQGSEKLSEFTGELQNAEGTGRRVAETMLEGLAGSLTVLRGSIETLMIVIGERFLPRLTAWVDKGVEIVNAMANWSDATWNMIATIGGLLAVMGPILVIYAKLRMFTLQWAAAKALATGAVVKNTAAMAASTPVMAGYSSGLMAVGGAAKKSAGLLGGLIAKAGALVASSGPLLGVAAVLGVAAAYWHEYTKAMAVDYRTFADVVKDSHSEMMQTLASSQLAGLDMQYNAQSESLASRAEYLESKRTLNKKEAEELEELYAELARIEERREAERLAWRTIQEQQLGEAIKNAELINAEKIADQFDSIKADRMAQLEKWHADEVQAIVDHHVEMGTVGSEEFYADLEKLEGQYGDRLELIHILLGHELEAYEEHLAAIGLVYDQELGELITIVDKNLRDQGAKVREHMEGFKDEYEEFSRGNWAAYNRGQREAEDEVVTTTIDVMDAALQGVSHHTQVEAENKGKEFGENVAGGIEHQSGRVRSAGEFIGKAAGEGAESGMGDGEDIGESWIAGIIRGMWNWASNLRDAAVDVVRNAYDAAKSWLQSQSPSKKTMELGNWWSQGLAIGIRQSADMITRAVDDVTGRLNPELSFAGISNEITGLSRRTATARDLYGFGGNDHPRNMSVNATYNVSNRDLAEFANNDLVKKLQGRGLGVADR